MLETSTVYGVRNGSFHSFDVFSYDGNNWQSDLDGEQFDACWKAETHVESILKQSGYQVFFDASEAAEFMAEMVA